MVTAILEEYLGVEDQTSPQELVHELCDLVQDRGASVSPGTESISTGLHRDGSPPDTVVIEATAQAPAKPKRRKKLTLVPMNQPVL